MTPTEIRAARHALGMTHRQFGAALGVQEQTARRWQTPETASQHRVPSETVVRLIRVLLATVPRIIPEVKISENPRDAKKPNKRNVLQAKDDE